jgi:AcrR family transcriptional regulator
MPKIRAANIADHKELTRADILAAAERVFLEHGYAKASFADIAAEVGIGRTTLYEYFRSKDELLLAYVEAVVPPALGDIIAGLPDDWARLDRVLALVRGVLEYNASHQQVGLIVTRVGRKLPKRQQDRMWRIFDPVFAELARIIPPGMESGEFVTAPVPFSCRLVADVLMAGVAMLMRVDDPFEILDEVNETICGFLTRALAP